MYWLVENNEQLNLLINSGYDKGYIDIIPKDHIKHPAINEVSLLYIRPINATKGHIICIDHDEAFSVDSTLVDTLLNKFKVLYCRDKKELLHYYPLKTLVDINTHPNTYIRENTRTHNIFYYKHKDTPDVNTIIPIVKHFEMCEIYYDYQKDFIKDKLIHY